MDKNKEYYIAMLRETSNRLGRLPKKSDFSTEDVNKIKGFFGPWPHALAQAGLIEPKGEQKKAENRQRARLNRKKSND